MNMWWEKETGTAHPEDMINQAAGFRAALVFLTLLAFAVTVLGIGSQPPSGDDYGVALTAIQYMENGQLGPAMWNHPFLRNILVYLSLKVFGSGVLGVKLWSMLFGTLTAPLLAAITLRLFRSVPVALIAGLFMCLDPLRIDFSRQGINDIYLAFFPLAGLYLALRYLESRRMWQMLGAGIMFGCGLASKWSVAVQLVATTGYVVMSIVRDDRLAKRERPAELLFVTAALTLLPAMVYLATFIPWFARGYGLAEWWELQGQMWLETRTHTGYLQINVERDHRAYEWFIRPVSHISYVLLPAEMAAREGARLLLSFGNPLVWLLTIPSLGHLAFRTIKSRDVRYGFAAALFLLSYLPFLLTGRPIWVNTALVVIPYAFIVVAHGVWTFCDRWRYRGVVLGIYLTAVTILNVPLYLLATGRGDEYSLLRPIVERHLPSDMQSLTPPP